MPEAVLTLSGSFKSKLFGVTPGTAWSYIFADSALYWVCNFCILTVPVISSERRFYTEQLNISKGFMIFREKMDDF